MDTSTMSFQGGQVLMGGSPLKLLRLSEPALRVVRKWSSGQPVGTGRGAQRLARRLLSVGTHLPVPASGGLRTHDVTVVIPVRDRPEQLKTLLSALDGMACVVVDDASENPARTEATALEFGAHFIGLRANRGPSQARNVGLGSAATELVAFVDSDCVPEGDWLAPILDLFDDPLVGAVAPRVAPAEVSPPTRLSRYERVRSSLDMGTTPGLVRPLSRLSYVPSAALVVRRIATALPFFDPELRGGEDVDLVWRLTDAGWDVRYAPASVVHHHGPETFSDWVTRRAFYGTTAGPLSVRHPGRLVPLHTSAWTAGVWGLMAARRPLASGVTLAASVLMLARRLRNLVDQPVKVAVRVAGGGTARSLLPGLGGLTRAWSPGLVLGLLFKRTRRPAAVALLLPAVGDWLQGDRDLDLVSFTALHVADDLSYGAGVLVGCLRERTLEPFLPRISWRSRVWSAASLQAQLAGTRPDPPSQRPDIRRPDIESPG
jgi:mycofactocin glycosyltransferase